MRPLGSLGSLGVGSSTCQGPPRLAPPDGCSAPGLPVNPEAAFLCGWGPIEGEGLAGEEELGAWPARTLGLDCAVGREFETPALQ